MLDYVFKKTTKFIGIIIATIAVVYGSYYIVTLALTQLAHVAFKR